MEAKGGTFVQNLTPSWNQLHTKKGGGGGSVNFSVKEDFT